MNSRHDDDTTTSSIATLSTVHVSTDQTSSTRNEQQTITTARMGDHNDRSDDEESQYDHHRTTTTVAAAVGTTSMMDDIEQQQNNDRIKEPHIIDQTIEDDQANLPKGNRFTNLFKDGRTIAVLLVVGGGTAVAFQSAANGAMRVAAGRSFSSVTNFVVGLFMEILAFLFDILIVKTPKPTVKRLKEAPWYSWIGGILGTYYVIVNIFTVTQMGAGVVLSVFVCSQVITACIMDHFGIAGIQKRKFTIWRILGSLGLIGCVAVITIF